MPLELSKNGFVLLKDPKTGYINYSVLFEAADRDIMGLFGTMNYFTWDIFEEGEPKSLKHHIRRGNVKVINGDLYFKNPNRFDEQGIIFADMLVPHIVPKLYVARQMMIDAFTNGRPLIFAFAEDEEGLKESIKNGELSEKQIKQTEKWHETIMEFNDKIMDVLRADSDKYTPMLHFLGDEE